MTFPLNVYLLAFASACLTTRLATPLWRKWCLRHGWVDDPGVRKIHAQPVALAGGPALMTGLLLPLLVASLLLWWRGDLGLLRFAPGPPNAPPRLADPSISHTPASSLLLYGLAQRAIELTGIFLGAIGMLAVGWLDDKRELRAGPKFVAQLFVAALVAASGARITLFVHNSAFHYAITILWILTLINAFNFMDNMNGLCAGLGAIGAAAFGLIAAAGGQYLVALLAFLTLGALLGFLPCNFPRARAFLGDSGSHLVGYLLAVLAILPHFYTPYHQRPFAVLFPLLVLGVPLFDLVYVVILRWRLGRPFYLGDNNHLSHRLVRRGLTRTQAVVVIWIMAFVLASLPCFL